MNKLSRSADWIDQAEPRKPRKVSRLDRLRDAVRNPGFVAAVPISLLFIAGFLAPLTVVVLFAFMPPETFSLLQVPTLDNFRSIFAGTYYLSFVSSLELATCTVVILLVVCYPLAVAMVRIFGNKGSILAIVLAAPLFVADNLRLMGWMLFLVKGGVVSGTLQTYFGIELDSMLYTFSATLFGLVYIYLPFMLFPMVLGVSMVPPKLREAAFDLGATNAQVLREIDIPLAMPGIIIGALICFILVAGAITEAKVLGGTAVVMIAQDIQKEFTFAQNWPKGSALSVLLIAMGGALSWALFKRVDLDTIFGRK
ncbi:ABC-type spermidine/putrescine transport system permease subunit I [Hoeflea marina]|uniref:ABC-type spermidine/putrescine transport system permease subunit I n=1 Tax=Hoeflea marina TaxID=274592 RepID=A0A317PKF7_9HYPH|nr:ABC transporter permease [Hoeflea marina]PWW00278.1 ABC-type spermidine/putrescine transport system permease subunit I [Hoeflea marina]